MEPRTFLSIIYVPLAAVLLRGTVFLLSLDDPPERQNELKRMVWRKCLALGCITFIVGYMPFPLDFLLAKVFALFGTDVAFSPFPISLILACIVSFVGIKILFYKSFGMAFFAFLCYSSLLWAALWGIGQVIS